MSNDYAVFYRRREQSRLDAKIRYIQCYSKAFRSVYVSSLRQKLIYFVN